MICMEPEHVHPRGMIPEQETALGLSSRIITMTAMTVYKEVILLSTKAVITAVTNQKGGTGKTTTCENLGVGLANEGKKVLLVDCDPQASLTIALGNPRQDDLNVTLSDLMSKVMQDQPIVPGEGILHHAEGVDLVPANIALAGTEVSLVNAMSRETILINLHTILT